MGGVLVGLQRWCHCYGVALSAAMSIRLLTCRGKCKDFARWCGLRHAAPVVAYLRVRDDTARGVGYC